ncbi:MAG: sigma-54-dependent Fis family transcriptional regulator [Candidatus Rokubacteria bacterium]|nr:sigma-54-dependent Fis family transcriptional regulator [Candidatus Rokubacteria bacterium]
MRRTARILVVDDEPDMAENVALILEGAGHDPVVETDSRRALEAVERERPDVLITDLRMPGVDGLTLIERLRPVHPELPIVVLTAYASVESAVVAMQHGANDYLAKPFAPEELLLRVDRSLAWTRLREENRYLREAGDQYADIVGRSQALHDVLRIVDRVAATDARVLLVGESGTGKELIARTLHRRSARREAPFFAVNCGALTESLLESELFGHERGAFTGAIATKKGIFEVADTGTLLLDEITETSPAFQTKLLRVVQQGEVQRVGGTRPIKVDVRVISATNRDLRRAVADGRFREDLFYRVSVVRIDLPPLRERREDIPLLVAHFVGIYAAQIKKRVRGVHPDTMDLLCRYPWPGNVRELENVVERAIIMTDDGEELTPDDLPGDLRDAPPDPGPMAEVAHAERELIVRMLRDCAGNRTLAAQKLGIGRRTLYDKLARLGISLRAG